jgi:hypothetical protein
MHQQFWGYKVEWKVSLGVRGEKRLNTTAVEGREKKTTEGQLMTTLVESRVKTTDPSSRQGRSPMTSTP